MNSRVVVGVDGSPESVAALGAAVQEARWRGATLQAVAAYAYPYAVLVVPFAPDPPTLEGLEREALATIDKALQAVREAGTATDGVAIEPKAVSAAPATALLDAAQGADLLVLGARGRGGFKGLLLGSVSQQCVQHAPCPVLIVPREPT